MMKKYCLYLALLISNNVKSADLVVYIDQIGNYTNLVWIPFTNAHPHLKICPVNDNVEKLRIPDWNFVLSKDIFAYCVQNLANNSFWVKEYNQFVGDSEMDVTIVPIPDSLTSGYVEPGYYQKCECFEL